MKYFYGIFSILGILLPFSQFVPWILANGFEIPLLIAEASSNAISSFAWLDVIVSAVVLLVFIFFESSRLQMRYWWLPVVGTLTVGVSFGLPLFLLLRELHLENERTSKVI